MLICFKNYKIIKIMYIILAVSEDNVIGANNKLPWRIPYDLLWFKNEYAW